jgi:hypothetical protein
MNSTGLRRIMHKAARNVRFDKNDLIDNNATRHQGVTGLAFTEEALIKQKQQLLQRNESRQTPDFA